MLHVGHDAAPKPVALTYGNLRANALAVAGEPRTRPRRPLAVPDAAVPRRRLSILIRSRDQRRPRPSCTRGSTAQGVLHALTDPERRITLVSLVRRRCRGWLDAGCGARPTLRRGAAAAAARSRPRCCSAPGGRRSGSCRPTASPRRARSLARSAARSRRRGPLRTAKARCSSGGPMVVGCRHPRPGWTATGRPRFDRAGTAGDHHGPQRRHDRHGRRERLAGGGRGGTAVASGRRGRRCGWPPRSRMGPGGDRVCGRRGRRRRAARPCRRAAGGLQASKGDPPVEEIPRNAAGKVVRAQLP